MQTSYNDNNYITIKYLIEEINERLETIEALINEQELIENEQEQRKNSCRCQQREHDIWREVEKQRTKEIIEKQRKKTARKEARRRAEAWAKQEYGK